MQTQNFKQPSSGFFGVREAATAGFLLRRASRHARDVALGRRAPGKPRSNLRNDPACLNPSACAHGEQLLDLQIPSTDTTSWGARAYELLTVKRGPAAPALAPAMAAAMITKRTMLKRKWRGMNMDCDDCQKKFQLLNCTVKTT